MDLCLKFQTSHRAKGASCGEETTDLLTIVSKDLIGQSGEETTGLWIIISKDLIELRLSLTRDMVIIDRDV